MSFAVRHPATAPVPIARPRTRTAGRKLGSALGLLVVLVCQSLVTVVVTFGCIALLPGLFGITSTVVMSNSMSPSLWTGDVVLVRTMPAMDVRVGQVLLVDDPDTPGRLRLHRLKAKEHGEFLLKGDANAQADSSRVAPKALHGVGFLRVPWIGSPIFWLRTGMTGAAAAAVVGLLIVGAVAAIGTGTEEIEPEGRHTGERQSARLRLKAALRRRRRRLKAERRAARTPEIIPFER